MKKYKINVDNLSKRLFIVSLLSLIFAYGFLSSQFHIFPYSLIANVKSSIGTILKDKENRSWYYQKTDHTKKVIIYNKKSISKGLTLISSLGKDNTISLKVIDINGSIVHSWDVDWFKIWPDATHLPEKDLPKSRPGTQIHGMVLLKNGDVVFNYATLGLVRLDVCGNVVWRLPYRTHHSVYLDEYDNLWVPGQKNHEERLSAFPAYKPPFLEPTVLKISLEGKILDEISIFDLLKENKLESLLYMSALHDYLLEVSGDTLHFNDLETFPSYMDEGVFKHGDIMISLRNISAIIIFSEKDRKVKYVDMGGYVRQHDPDFIDGNTISIFDNHNTSNIPDFTTKRRSISDNKHIASTSENNIHKSRIVIKSFADKRSFVYYEGNKKHPFYTSMMGKHQWLPNGNLLITETLKGRAFEIDPKGNIVWEYFNIVKKGYIGIISEAQRLPVQYTKAFFDKKVQECKNKKLNL